MKIDLTVATNLREVAGGQPLENQDFRSMSSIL